MITRAQMQRQLRNNGGIMTVKTIRQKYGLGDLVGDVGNFVRKLIPKEVARFAEVSAPIAAVAAPQFALPAAIVGGLGRFQRTGDLGSSALYGGAVGLGGMASKRFGFGGPDSFLSKRGIGGGIGFKESARNILLGSPGEVMAGTGDLIPGTKGLFGAEGTFGLGKAIGKGTPGIFLGTTALALLGQKLVGPKREDETEGEYLQRRKTAVGGYLRRYYSQLNPTASATDVESFVQRNLVEYKAEGGRIGFDNGGVSSIFGNPDQLEYEEFMKKRSRNIITFESNLAKRLMNKYDLDSNTARRYAGTINFYVNSNPRMLSGKEKILEEGYLGNNEIILKEIENKDNINSFAINRSKGGIMDVPVKMNSEGVKELDMRKTGGFVPIGVKEKADDVPAMLSLNEFVMTADAVRGAGDGSIEKGAQRMYDTMKKLENRVA